MHQSVHSEGHIMAVQLLDGGLASPLERLVDDYLTSCRARGLSPRTDEQYGYALRAVFLPWCVSEDITRLDQLDRRAFDRYTSMLLAKRNRYGQPVSKFSVHSFLRPVRLLLNWATREGEEVLARPQLPRREKPVRDVLSREEIDQLERVMVSERDKLIIRIFSDCGLRLDELTRLKAGDIVRSGRQAHFRVLGKRGRVRDVPVPPTLLRRLDRFIDARPADRESDRLFLGHRRRGGVYTALTDIGVYQVVKDAFRRARMTKPVYPHLLRHSWMTEMLRNGMNPFQLSIIAGASQEVIAQHYTHLTKDDAYEAMLRALSAGGR
jgi:integrase/recombinase XerD